jgi:hypothetical protein
VRFLLFFCLLLCASSAFPYYVTFERLVDSYILYRGQMKVRKEQGRCGKDIKCVSFLISEGRINPHTVT